MSEPYPNLFSSLQLRHKTVKNRIVFGAHTPNMSHEGVPGPPPSRLLPRTRPRRCRDDRSRALPRTPTGVLTGRNFLHESDAVIPHFRTITDECHAHGTVMMHQLYHVGGHGDQDNSWEAYWSPSGVPSYHDPWGSHAMTEAEIEELIEAFIQAARRDKESGFDGTDLFAGYNCLLDQFWSPLTNHRDDRWGGSLENRLRFTTRICEGIRRMNGDDFIIGMTISGAEPYPGGLSIEDKQEIVAWLDERALVDYYSCGTGSYLNQFSKIVPSFHYDMMLGPPDAAQFKQVVKHAKVTAEARVKTPDNAEKVLASGSSDLVSMVRSQIADPHMANKAKAGAVEDIRPCISCNQLCLGRRLRDYAISCLVNPSVSREHEWDGDTVPVSPTPKEVLVVGGGPAGLEARPGGGRARSSGPVGGEDRGAWRSVSFGRRPTRKGRSGPLSELGPAATAKAASACRSAYRSLRGGHSPQRHGHRDPMYRLYTQSQWFPTSLPTRA